MITRYTRPNLKFRLKYVTLLFKHLRCTLLLEKKNSLERVKFTFHLIDEYHRVRGLGKFSFPRLDYHSINARFLITLPIDKLKLISEGDHDVLILVADLIPSYFKTLDYATS